MSYWDLGNIGLGQTVRQGDALGGMFPAPETSSTSSLKEELDALASRGLDAAPTPTLGDLDAFKADLNASLKDYYATRLA